MPRLGQDFFAPFAQWLDAMFEAARHEELRSSTIHRSLRRMAGLVFLLVSGCWRALAKGTAWAGFYLFNSSSSGAEELESEGEWRVQWFSGVSCGDWWKSVREIATPEIHTNATATAPNHPNRLLL